MKNYNLKSIFIVIVIFLGTVNIFAQVGIGTTSPDTTSMLDIQSTTKGVLIPRMLSGERTSIASPANGLLVFDTTSNSFWFYNIDAWKELTTVSSIVDSDGDTKVEVEKTLDLDEINFKTSGVERMKIDANGVIIMGDSTASNKNYTKITTDGSLSYVGEATRWEDLKVPVNSIKIGGGKRDDITFIPAEWDAFKEPGIALLWFADANDVDDEQDIVFTVQMPHGWKEGSAIFPHVHWTTGRLDVKNANLVNSPVPGAGRVTWKLQYTWANAGDVFPNTNEVAGTVVSSLNEGSISLYEHVITPLGNSGIDGTGKTLSSMLICRLYRNSSASSDTYSGDAGLLEIDFHYQIDSDGSNEEYSKW